MWVSEMQSHATRNYAIVTAAYWGFTLTDGALRMLVLLHFYRLGYSPFALAFLFLLYEAAGVLANLIGGWLATRYGITRMLTVGLVTQIIGFSLLAQLNPEWSVAMSVAWVVLAQGICGVAKDLTKTASKSAIKVTSAQAQEQGAGQLFKWVAWFTGSKNAMKGVGFFLGGLLLEALGFQQALWAMAALLAMVLAGVVTSLPRMMGKSKASKSAKELFAKNAGINALAAARVVLFGARDAVMRRQPATDQVRQHARRLVEQEQEGERERRIAQAVKVQQHQHAQRAVGEREAPVGGGDDGVVARGVARATAGWCRG